MELFPVVAIGRPPHSGKSVLAYSLSKGLRARQIAHYVLRAFPDGEGDWANEADQALVRRIRIKGSVTLEWIQHICRDIARRHLPLIVDMGGQPSDWQEAVLDHCTHIILLTRDRTSYAYWIRLARRHDLQVIANLHSVRSGEDVLYAHSPVLRGHVSGLERGSTATGVVATALGDSVASLFAYDQEELRRTHIANALADLVVELERLGCMLATAMGPLLGTMVTRAAGQGAHLCTASSAPGHLRSRSQLAIRRIGGACLSCPAVPVRRTPGLDRATRT